MEITTGSAIKYSTTTCTSVMMRYYRDLNFIAICCNIVQFITFLQLQIMPLKENYSQSIVQLNYTQTPAVL